MSETDGRKPDWLERLERVEASHVRLMTDYEVFAREQRRAWDRHEKFIEGQERAWEAQRERDAAIDARFEKLGDLIADLVSGIGELLRSPGERPGK